MRVAVMEGSFAAFDLPTVMQAVGAGPKQFTTIETLDDDNIVVGQLVIHDGQIISATSESQSGLDAVMELVKRDEKKRFAVFRESIEDHEGAAEPARVPIISVNALLFRLLMTNSPAIERVQMVEGTLEEFDLPSVMDVVSVSRQFTVIELLSQRDDVIGTIELKSGQLLAARYANLHGRDAIERLMQIPKSVRFRVSRGQLPADRVPFGSVIQVLSELPNSPPSQPPFWSPPTARARVLPALPPAPSHAAAPVGDAPVLCVTSPRGGSGKTTVVLNLAVAMARQGKRVTIIDASGLDDVLVALNQSSPSALGAYDVASGKVPFSELRPVSFAGVQIVPAGDTEATPSVSEWQDMLRSARSGADVVLVDTATSMHRSVANLCAASDYSLIVLAAEPTASRVLPVHVRRMEALGSSPTLLGILLNLIDYHVPTSFDVLKSICTGVCGSNVLEVTIPRSNGFVSSLDRGVPLCTGDRKDTPPLGWIFEALAAAVLERVMTATTSVQIALRPA